MCHILNENCRFAVLDTETNWSDKIMSVGVTIAGADFSAVESRYYILTPECQSGGMFSAVLKVKDVEVFMEDSREKVFEDIKGMLEKYGVQAIFAYNAAFDMKHMPEFSDYWWFDIIRLAAYRQYNSAIPEDAACYATGRLKRGYGVEPIMRGLSKNKSYKEVHNAMCDALDELTIMKLLGHPISDYECAVIRQGKMKSYPDIP